MDKILNNFYKEFSYNSMNFEHLLNMYKCIFDQVDYMITQHMDNLIIHDIGTYYYIPIQSIQVEDAHYDLESLLSNPDISDKYSLSGLSIQERVNYWTNVASVKEKIDILNMRSKYIQLTTQKIGVSDNRVFDVVDFDIESSKGNSLIRNIDYAFEDNKIYFLRNIPQPVDKVILTDIAIDYKDVDNRIGSRILSTHNSVVPKNYYREIAQALLYLGLKGPNVRDINDALNTLSDIGFGPFKIIDKPSAKGFYKDFWDITKREHRVLSQFEFMILTPVDVVTDPRITKMVTEYLSLTKLARTNFIMTPYIDVLERYKTTDLIHHVTKTLSPKLTDKLKYRELTTRVQNLNISAERAWSLLYDRHSKFLDKLNMYDSGILNYDLPPLVADIFKHLDAVQINYTKSIKDRINRIEKKRFDMSLGIDNAADNIRYNEAVRKVQYLNIYPQRVWELLYDDYRGLADKLHTYDSGVPIYDFPSVVADIFNHLDMVSISYVQQINERIKCTSKKRLNISLNIDGSSGKLDKIIAKDNNNSIVGTEIKSKINNVGTVNFYDNEHIFDSDTDSIEFDSVTQTIGDYDYFDTVNIKLIRKSVA